MMMQFQLIPGVNVDVRDGTHDWLVFRESWRDDQYRMATLPKPSGDALALDLGANVGSWSILAAMAGALVYAVECWGANNDQHVRNKFATDTVTKIVVMEAAVVGHQIRSGMVELDNIGDKSQVGVHTHDHPDQTQTDRPLVRAIHIDELLALHDRWWCLKCDIEGGEYDVFAGVDLALLNRVDYITMEFHAGANGAPVEWIGGKGFGDLVTKLCDWGNITTMGSASVGGNIFGHRFGVEAPILGAERIPIIQWLRR